ncbi:MAG: SDR family oxidoreductase [Deltaproteobacteria bacterium]|nr:SDR family oxidoreductase [Deltaproteobacteria bacterium]
MHLELAGRVAMVAAASKGIGRACALALAAEGCRVSICARNPHELEKTRKELLSHAEAHATVADVSSETDIARWHSETMARLGRVDILLTNTGGPPAARFFDLTEEQWDASARSLIMSVVRLVRLVAPGMQSRRWGRLVFLSSFVAKQPVDELTISSTFRAGLSALTKTLANQLGPDNITVNAVLTGHVLTARQEQLADLRSKERGITPEEYLAKVAADIPLRRMGQPREIGDTVAFLASQRASYLTGVSLQVDGGITRSAM